MAFIECNCWESCSRTMWLSHKNGFLPKHYSKFCLIIEPISNFGCKQSIPAVVLKIGCRATKCIISHCLLGFDFCGIYSILNTGRKDLVAWKSVNIMNWVKYRHGSSCIRTGTDWSIRWPTYVTGYLYDIKHQLRKGRQKGRASLHFVTRF